jgi:hypothetical protein
LRRISIKIASDIPIANISPDRFSEVTILYLPFSQTHTTETMRDIHALLKTQIVSSESTINHALQLNEELESLRRDCKNLQDRNQRLATANECLLVVRDEHAMTIQVLKHELEESQMASKSREKKLQEQLNQLQVSWNSLYDDLSKVRDERNELKGQLDNVEESTLSTQVENSRRVHGVRQNAAGDPSGGEVAMMSPEGVGAPDQADHLRNAIQRHASCSPSTYVERMMHSLKIDNLTQNSTIVKLQTKLKEEPSRHEQVASNSTFLGHRPEASRVTSRSVSVQPSSSSVNNTRSDVQKWRGDDDDGGCPPMDFPSRSLERKDTMTTINVPMRQPTRTESLQRIQEYKSKKSVLVNEVDKEEERLIEDSNSVSTSSTESTKGSAGSYPSLSRVALRTQSLHPSRQAALNASLWGRSPSRTLTRENDKILACHPAYQTKLVDDDAHSSFSSLGETSTTLQPNRSRSLVRWW